MDKENVIGRKREVKIMLEGKGKWRSWLWEQLGNGEYVQIVFEILK